jgi:hypothetical protein
MHGKTNCWLSGKETTNPIHVDSVELMHLRPAGPDGAFDLPQPGEPTPRHPGNGLVGYHIGERTGVMFCEPFSPQFTSSVRSANNSEDER